MRGLRAPLGFNGGVASADNEYPFPPDQFDQEADAVGAHGAHRVDEPFWKQNRTAIIVIVLAVLACVAAFWVTSMVVGQDGTPAPATQSAPPASDAGGAAPEQAEGADGTEEEAAPAQPDLSRPILVLNGTRTNGLAGQWKSTLEAAGWQSVDTDTGPRSETGGVYYRTEEDQATAAALAEALGVEAVQSDQFESSITAVVTERPQQ